MLGYAKWIRVLFAALAIPAMGAGCVNIRYCGFEESIRTYENREIPPYVRSEVHLFMMNGTDLLEVGGMLDLRDRISNAGYCKVYYAQRQDINWYRNELSRLYKEDPSARIILLGYGAGAQRTVDLALESIQNDLPLDSVILIDPLGVTGDLTAAMQVPTLLIRSHNWVGGSGITATNCVNVPRVGHVAIANHFDVVQHIVATMNASSAKVVLDTDDNIPRLSMTDHPDPSPRPYPKRDSGK